MVELEFKPKSVWLQNFFYYTEMLTVTIEIIIIIKKDYQKGKEEFILI